MMKHFKLIPFFSLALFALLECSLLGCYSPEPFVEELDDTSSNATAQTSNIGKIYPVNAGKQICNPSVSNDIENYPGAMLWLNFGGTLNVKTDDSLYTTSRVIVHDRLTVSDTSGFVKWYLLIDKEGENSKYKECQFQDPEWSTHADFIVALRGFDKEGKSACENLDFGIFAVRTKDKKKFWFKETGISETATPHVWVSPDAFIDTTKADSTLEGFFGTKDVRLTYVNLAQEIVYINYASASPKEITLKKPANRKSWDIDSPMISPDGNFVVYNMVDNATTWEAYIQKISSDSEPVLLPLEKGMASYPAQPHWQKEGNTFYVLWAEFPSGSPMLNKDDLTKESVQNGSVGRTARRSVNLETMAFGAVEEVVKVPMIGGISPDGAFLATGTNLGFLIEGGAHE